MRIATFNVLHGRLIHQGRPLPLSTGDAPDGPLARAVASLAADVLALQEVDRCQERSGRADQARAAAAAMGARDWRYAAALHGSSVPGKGWVLEPAVPGLRVYQANDTVVRGRAGSHGIALLTRLPVQRWRALRLPAAPAGQPLRVAGRPGLTVVRDRPRAALAAVLESERGPLTVVAVHLSFVPGWNLHQLALLRRWIADLPRPYLLLGDFNLPGPVPRLALSGAAREPQGWRDLARTPTYPSHRPLVQFDHILAAGLPRNLSVAVDAPLTPISDHRPLVVELAMRTGPTDPPFLATARGTAENTRCR